MESIRETESASFKEFLEQFSRYHCGPVLPEDSLPFRLTTYYLTEGEAEAECLDWTLQYLHLNKCPYGLAMSLARRVTDEVLQQDLTLYYEDQGGTDRNRDEENDEDGGNSSTDSSQHNLATAPGSDPYLRPLRLDADKYARAVFSMVHDVCERWQIALPLGPPIRCKFDISVHAVKNKRRKMEDKHVAIHDLNTLFSLKDMPAQSYYAVFDGHGGTDAAIYAAAHLHTNIVRHPAFQTDIHIAMKEGFRKTDRDFVLKAERENLHSGTTGVCALVRDNKICVAWLGDSQAVLVRDNQPIEVVNPHKPEREDEKRRIENLGGCVVWFGAWRVNGSLSVSRAIGDADHKPYVSGEPDLTILDLDGSEDYLILACDGLWDTVSSAQTTALITEHLNDNAGDRSQVAHKLVKVAADNGSNDNISVIVVFLREAEAKLEEPAENKEREKISAQDECKDRSEREKDSQNENNKDVDPGSGDREKEKKEQENTERQGGGDSERFTTERHVEQDSSAGTSPEDSAIDSTRSSLGNLDLSEQGDSSNEDKNMLSRSDSQKPVVSSSPEESDNSVVQSVRVSPIQSGGDGELKGSPVQSDADKSDVHSDTSGTELALMSKTATRCINNRKAKRAKSSRNGHMKDCRRANRGRMGSAGLLHSRTPGVPPRSRSAESNLAQAQRSMLRSGDQIFELITGCTPNTFRKVKGNGKWTVAVEMENASDMFDDHGGTNEEKGLICRRRSDTPVQYQKK